MKLFDKTNSDEVVLNIAEKIGNSIRKEIISCKMQNYHLKEHCLSQIRPKKSSSFSLQFWKNPYKTQKSMWNVSFPKHPFIYEKKGTQNYERQQLEKFKSNLKRSLQIQKSTKQSQLLSNKHHIKQLRFQLSHSFKQRRERMLYHKQCQAELIRRILRQKKVEGIIQKRKFQLDMQYRRWQQHQLKLPNQQEYLKTAQRFKTYS